MHTQSNLSLPLGRTVLRLVIWRGEPRIEGIWPFTAFLAAALSPRSFLRVTTIAEVEADCVNTCETPIPGLLKGYTSDIGGRFHSIGVPVSVNLVACVYSRSLNRRFLEERKNGYRDCCEIFVGYPFHLLHLYRALYDLWKEKKKRKLRYWDFEWYIYSFQRIFLDAKCLILCVEYLASNYFEYYHWDFRSDKGKVPYKLNSHDFSKSVDRFLFPVRGIVINNEAYSVSVNWILGYCILIVNFNILCISAWCLEGDVVSLSKLEVILSTRKIKLHRLSSTPFHV